MTPRIDHIDLTVRDLDREEAFYDALLPLLGFDLANKGRGEEPGFEYRAVDYSHKAFSLTLVCPRPAFAEEEVCRRKPGSLHHLAFGAGSREEVDRLYALVKEIPGVSIVSSPKFWADYAPDYYAFFFKDPDGIKLEIVHFDRPSYF